MTPEHTDRDLRERAQALLDAWDAHGYMRPSSLAAAFGELRAALTASEGPRGGCICDDDAREMLSIDPEVWAPEFADPDCSVHGIEASEGGSATPEQEVRGERARAQLLEDVHRAADDVRGHWGIENTEGYDEAMSDLALALDVLTAAERDGSVPATPTPPEQSHPRGRSAELLPDPQHPTEEGEPRVSRSEATRLREDRAPEPPEPDLPRCPDCKSRYRERGPRGWANSNCRHPFHAPTEEGEPAEVRGERVTLWRIMASWEPMHRSYQAAKDHPAYEVATFERIPEEEADRD